MGKMIVLKPVVWSSNGYKFPAGIEKRGKDFVAQNGFGHEEWNGDPDRVWKGQRIFHTENPGMMEDYASRGELGIIMTAYAKSGGMSGPHAVGIATSVSLNSKMERRVIAKSLKAADHAQAMWALPSIKNRHTTYTAFKRWWGGESSEWLLWRCPPAHYQWFEKPILLDAKALFPPRDGNKPAQIIKMFSAYMPVLPDQALAIVWRSIGEDSPIVEWLLSGTFDDVAVSAKTKSYGRSSPSGGPKNHSSAPPAKDPYVRYIEGREITVTPQHHEIQQRFRAHIEADGARGIKTDRAGVDIQFKLEGHGTVLAEVKPCDKSDARYAVRTAMGQLLDYAQRHSVQPVRLLIVVGTKPSAEDIALATLNGFGLAYPRGAHFVLKWP